MTSIPNGWSRHAGSRHRLNCPLADRARHERVAGQHAARRPGRPDGARRARQSAGAEPPPDRRPDPGLRPAGRRAGLQHGPRRRRRARLRLPARHHRQPVLLVVAADHPDGLPRDQGRRGRRVHLRGRRDGVPVRQGQLRLLAGHQEPAVRRGPGAYGRRRRGRRRMARSPRRREHPRRLHRDGSDRRERRHPDRHQPRRAGPLGRAQPEPGRGRDQERVLRARDRLR